jgi:ABC-type lipoprotein export system ATPase subunit
MDGEQKKQSLSQIVSKLNSIDVSAFGIMDYWTFDGYIEILKFQKDQNEIQLNKPIFPGMELRIESPTDYRLNIHVLLSNELSVTRLNEFKSHLKIRGIDRCISDEAIIDFAKTLDDSKAKHHGYGPDFRENMDKLIELGSKTIVITRESLQNAMNSIPREYGLIIMPYDTSDGLEKLDWSKHPHDDNYFMQSSHMFETRSASNVDLFLGNVTSQNRSFIDNFSKTMGKKSKPVMSGSDAHRISDYGSFPGDRITWFKADTTFQGLLQICNEPTERCYIGSVPPKVSHSNLNRSKFIDNLQIVKHGTSRLSEQWFDGVRLEFSDDLVAIIGNKGTGKSALSDIVALACNAHCENFSFLNGRKFKEAKNNKAKNFIARLSVRDGSEHEVSLDSEVDLERPAIAKYIPQNYFEMICNESGSGVSHFESELQGVIFSHLEPFQKAGYKNLQELINAKTREIDEKIIRYRGELKSVNIQIMQHEQLLSPDYQRKIQNTFEQLLDAYKRHIKSRPIKVTRPALDPAKESLIRKHEASLKRIAKHEDILRSKMQLAYNRMELVQLLIQKFDNHAIAIDSFVKSVDQDINLLGMQLAYIYSYKIDTTSLRQVLSTESIKFDKFKDKLTKEDGRSLFSLKKECEEQSKMIKSELAVSFKTYQENVEALTQWKSKARELVGDKGNKDSIRGLHDFIKNIEKVYIPSLDVLRKQRYVLTCNIHSSMLELADVYKGLYGPVQDYINSHPVLAGKFTFDFGIGLNDNGFVDGFISSISQQFKGTYYGSENALERVGASIASHDFVSQRDIMLFVDEILHGLNYDLRNPDLPIVSIYSQLRDKAKASDFYDFLFSLQYLKLSYSLNFGQKLISQLSPGERGLLLLVFYLLVDRDDRPLIIDQPEENLDNQSIFNILVPCIKEAKKKRQIFVVTHNPNIAVVCDAEQVVCAHLDKVNNYTLQYYSGSIESVTINQKIVEILEGTWPAFSNRSDKYSLHLA